MVPGIEPVSVTYKADDFLKCISFVHLQPTAVVFTLKDLSHLKRGHLTPTLYLLSGIKMEAIYLASLLSPQSLAAFDLPWYFHLIKLD